MKTGLVSAVSKGNVLVVEDDAHINRSMCEYLRKHGFATHSLSTGVETLAYLHRVDLIVLDLNLPDLDGLEVLKRVREKSELPVLIASARAEAGQRVLGLELGADDYVIKPVYPAELLARVKALLRRVNRSADNDPSPLTFDAKARTVRTARVEISLAELEFQLLRFMADSPSKTFTREELLMLVWRQSPSKRTRRVDLAVSRIRVKFADRRLESPIESVRNVGYRFKNSD